MDWDGKVLTLRGSTYTYCTRMHQRFKDERLRSILELDWITRMFRQDRGVSIEFRVMIFRHFFTEKTWWFVQDESGFCGPAVFGVLWLRQIVETVKQNDDIGNLIGC